MLRKILIYGLVAGVIVGVPLFGIAIQGDAPPPYGALIGYTSMLLAFSLVFLAVKRQRDDVHGGVIKFLPALALGLGITFVASVIYVLAWELALAVTHMDFAGEYSRSVIEQARARGASAEELERLTAEMQAFAANYANPLIRAPMTFAEVFPVGLLVSLVSAGLLRNSRFLPRRQAPA